MVRKNFVLVFRSRNIVTNKQFVYKKNTQKERKEPSTTRTLNVRETSGKAFEIHCSPLTIH